jgi:drug/metabolite transporter (DMT)-like permease
MRLRGSALGYATVLALGTALISGFANFIAKIGVTAVKDPIVFTTLKNGIVAVLIVGIVLALRRWRELRTLSKRQWVQLFAIGVIGGSIPFALFFTGLVHTSAVNASLIHKTLFLWVALLAVPILKERMTPLQWLGILAVAAANLFIGGFQGFTYNLGELMILGATVLWAVENVIAKIALKNLSSLTVAAARMVLGSAVLLVFAAFRGGGAAVVNLNAAQWGWTFVASVLLAGYVLTWYAALKRAPATYVATLLVPATLVTNALAAVFLTHAFPTVQAMNALFVVTGVALVVGFARRVHPAPTPDPLTSAERP